MGGSYELVRTDDAAGQVLDLEAGRCAAVYPKGGGGGGCVAPPPVPSPPSSPASARQRLVSLDVFRGITVLRKPHFPDTVVTSRVREKEQEC
uniref:Uncharacterized protein n=1 Tax=Oryza meridionalis TaxID=40149 RepID=A0A0E0DDM6_9ORYZ